MYCSGFALQALSRTCPKPVLHGFWLCHTRPYTHWTLACQPCPESSLVCTALTDLHLVLLADLGTTQEFIAELIRIDLFSAWVMSWFKSIFSENVSVSSWIEAVSGESIWVLNSFDSFPKEATGVVSWKKHYFNRISRNSAGAGSNIEKSHWSQINSNQCQVSMHLRTELGVDSEPMFFASVTSSIPLSWFDSFLGKSTYELN